MVGFQLRHPHGINLQGAAVSASASGDNVIVPAVVGRRIKVVAYTLQATGTVNVKWRDELGVDLTGQFVFQAREGIAPGVPAPSWMFGTSPGSGLLLNLSAAVAVVGSVTYFDDDES